MSTVLLDDEVLPVTAGETIPVPVPVRREGDVLFFEPAQRKGYYVIEPERIRLEGSGGEPRGFELTFILSKELVEEGYRFANPALKFFQPHSRNAGFRFSPDDAAVAASATLFNTMETREAKAEDSFNLLLVDPILRRLIVHDPTIVWDPPGGG